MTVSMVLPSSSKRLESVEVRRLASSSDGHDLVGQLDELVVLGDEVGLAVDLDHDAVLGDDETLSGGALCALSDILRALDAQLLDGLVEIAVCICECVLTCHHSGAGELTEPLDVSGGVVRHD